MQNPILHIVVVGFHHKKGCQVEFSFPSLELEKEDGNTECPAGWKYLPTLALPDGSHNFDEDSVFFNLPSLTAQNESVYGVSCYRQISSEKLINRTADVTRSTVQKSVCILSSIPVYGYIEVKLSLIAHAYFDQGDFACTSILTKAYKQLNACLSDGYLGLPSINHIYIGLPLRDIILRWRYKTLILFKLMLLQKRVVCFGSPVRPISSLILAIASLHCDLLAKGFQQVACVQTSRPISPMPNFSPNDRQQLLNDDNAGVPTISITHTLENNKFDDSDDEEAVEDVVADILIEYEEKANGDSIEKRNEKNSLHRDVSVDALASSLGPLCSIQPHVWGAPLPIFTHGNLCLPYLSLPYMDLLTDPSVLGYTIGTSNILFQQKKQLADVLVDVEGGTIETSDVELKRQLTLSTEDLRFVDFIIRHVQQPKEGAEGSEQWIREQFQGYMLAMLRTSLLAEGSKENEHFNGSFMQTWTKTLCYHDWLAEGKLIDDSLYENIPSGHPFAGTLSVADMKLKIAQTMNNSESGRKLNQAVSTTSKAVGGALTQAKGAISTWWSAITTPPLIAAQATQQQTANTVLVDSSNDDATIALSNAVDDKNVINYASNKMNYEKTVTQPSPKIIEMGTDAEILLL